MPSREACLEKADLCTNTNVYTVPECLRNEDNIFACINEQCVANYFMFSK